MENAPVIVFSARTIPSDIEERYDKWYDAAYAPLYLKSEHYLGIDRYKIISRRKMLPWEIILYHADNFEGAKKAGERTEGSDARHDALTTFGKIERFWLKIYELIGSFKSNPSARGAEENTIVDNCTIIHIEGYQIQPADYGKFESWFNKWASQVYIPLLLKVPGVEAFNVFQLRDFDPPDFRGVRFIETEMPRYMSITYLENSESLGNYNKCIESAAFKRSLE